MLDTFYTLVWDRELALPYYKGYSLTNIRLKENLDVSIRQL